MINYGHLTNRSQYKYFLAYYAVVRLAPQHYALNHPLWKGGDNEFDTDSYFSLCGVLKVSRFLHFWLITVLLQFRGSQELRPHPEEIQINFASWWGCELLSKIDVDFSWETGVVWRCHLEIDGAIKQIETVRCEVFKCNSPNTIKNCFIFYLEISWTAPGNGEAEAPYIRRKCTNNLYCRDAWYMLKSWTEGLRLGWTDSISKDLRAGMDSSFFEGKTSSWVL